MYNYLDTYEEQNRSFISDIHADIIDLFTFTENYKVQVQRMQ